jgi:pimeloyl-ACP methyl ester carboxylesterase
MPTFRTGSGATLVGDVFGDEADPAVLLLHGGGQTRHSWRGSGAALAEAGFFALCLDARGHGDSSWAADGDYSLDGLADDLRAVCTELDRPVALVGASLGGLTAMIAAGEPPAVDCTGLVLVDVVPRMDPEGSTAVKRFMRARPDGFGSLEEAADAVAEYLPHRPRPRNTEGIAKNLRRDPDGRLRWHWDPRFLDDDDRIGVHQGARLEKALDAVTVPVLLVRGQRSDLVTDVYLDQFSRRHPQVELAEVGGARHMVAGDVNDAFSSAVTGFLARTARHRPPDRSVDKQTRGPS